MRQQVAQTWRSSQGVARSRSGPRDVLRDQSLSTRSTSMSTAYFGAFCPLPAAHCSALANSGVPSPNRCGVPKNR